MNGAIAVVLSAGATLVLCGCAGPTVINTDDAARPARSAAPPTLSTTVASNAHLANAFDFAAKVNGVTAYYFTSPSGRWQCAIKPRVEAGCQNASAPAARLRVAGAPDDLPGPDGEPAAANAIRVGRDRAAEFAVVPATSYGLDPEPATVLPFNRVLAVAGFRCNVQEATGISCQSERSGAGFTFSADEYAMDYVGVPREAP